MKKITTLFLASILLWSCSQEDELLSLNNGGNPAVELNNEEEEVIPYASGTYTMDFESIPAAARAVDKYGANLYSTYVGAYDPFVSYTDPTTGLTWGLNLGVATWAPSPYWSYEFYYGGIAVSNFNDRTTGDFSNQCSVNWGTDGANAGAGYNNSNNFAVSFGYTDITNNIAAPSIYFKDSTVIAQFNYMYVCNTTYAYQAMKFGQFVARPLDKEHKDYLKIVITGYDPEGSQTGKTEFYLADFRTGDTPGIKEGWNWVDLTPLNYPNKITFDVEGSDVGDYGLNTPAYFAFDNINFTLL